MLTRQGETQDRTSFRDRLSRRHFLKVGALGAAGLSLSNTVNGREPSDPIGYIQTEIPEFAVPPFDGERYEALVPDTLDLAEHARWAIHAMTENPNPAADYEPYWSIGWVPEPIMSADFASPTIRAKFQEAVCLCRLITGSKQNLHVDRRWMEVTLKEQGPDGLLYIPTRGRPWGREYPGQYIAGGRAPNIDQILSPFHNGQQLRTMSRYAARDGGQLWNDRIRRVVDGLAALAIDAGEYAYFWPGILWAAKDPPANVRPNYHFVSVEISQIPFGLTCAYRQTGHKPALALAGKLLAFFRQAFFLPDGAFQTTQRNAFRSHVHGHARGLVALADYAMLTDNQEMLAFVLKSYQWCRQRAEPLTGFFPTLVECPKWAGPTIPGDVDPGEHRDYTREEPFRVCEVAGLADMIGVALLLSESGVADCWDDVDRWVRNMVATSQLLQTDWVYQLPGAIGEKSAITEPRTRRGLSTTDRVPERNLGSWPTAALPNDWYEAGFGSTGFVHGDTANAARALYWIWSRILEHTSGKLRVNLLLNRASPWADIESYVPYIGRVDIKIKQAVELSVRLPEWALRKDVRVQVNGAERQSSWRGRYADIGQLKPGDTASLTFPIGERKDAINIHGRKYTLIRKGNEVVSIFPRGRYNPFYQREHYRRGGVRMRNMQRFVSKDRLLHS